MSAAKEMWTEVRRRVLTGQLSKPAACREYGINWRTLVKMLCHIVHRALDARRLVGLRPHRLRGGLPEDVAATQRTNAVRMARVFAVQCVNCLNAFYFLMASESDSKSSTSS